MCNQRRNLTFVDFIVDVDGKLNCSTAVLILTPSSGLTGWRVSIKLWVYEDDIKESLHARDKSRCSHATTRSTVRATPDFSGGLVPNGVSAVRVYSISYLSQNVKYFSKKNQFFFRGVRLTTAPLIWYTIYGLTRCRRYQIPTPPRLSVYIV